MKAEDLTKANQLYKRLMQARAAKRLISETKQAIDAKTFPMEKSSFTMEVRGVWSTGLYGGQVVGLNDMAFMEKCIDLAVVHFESKLIELGVRIPIEDEGGE